MEKSLWQRGMREDMRRIVLMAQQLGEATKSAVQPTPKSEQIDGDSLSQ